MTVRRLGPADASDWRALRLEALRTYPDAFITTHDEAAAVSLAEIAKALENGLTFGCFRDGRMVGIGSLRRETRTQTRHRAELGAYFVQPKAQGGGVADALMVGVCDAAKNDGIGQIELYVASSNARAIAFYARHGFVEAGRIPNATLSAGVPETDIIMIRFLT